MAGDDDLDPLTSYLNELAIQSMGDTFQPAADVRRKLIERAWHERHAKCLPPTEPWSEHPPAFRL